MTNYPIFASTMSKEYTVTYSSDNVYENWVYDAFWQFLIMPIKNESQEILDIDFKNSLHTINEFSVNGYGFKTIRVQSKKKFKKVSFEGKFKVLKSEIKEPPKPSKAEICKSYEEINSLTFKVNFQRFLKTTGLTTLPIGNKPLFKFDNNASVIENLHSLNNWVYQHLHYLTGVTDISSTLEKVLSQQSGVCQDFAHVFCALARFNGIPARYVSGYLNHESGYVGDSQMHAWAEAFVPDFGWSGFDPTNNITENSNHIKVSHGKDYNDCSPLKGVVHSQGNHKTNHSVVVKNHQQQIQQ